MAIISKILILQKQSNNSAIKQFQSKELKK